LPRRNETEDDATRRGKRAGKREYSPVHAYLLEPRDARRCRYAEQLHARHCDGAPKQTGDRRQERALDEKLAHKTRTASAERRANAELVETCRSARELEICHVDT